jgi:hypothetical protein
MRVHRVTALVRTAASAGDGSVFANGRLRLGAMPASLTKWPKRPSKREGLAIGRGTSRPLHKVKKEKKKKKSEHFRLAHQRHLSPDHLHILVVDNHKYPNYSLKKAGTNFFLLFFLLLLDFYDFFLL